MPYEFAMNDENIKEDTEIKTIVQKALIKINRNPLLLEDAIVFMKERKLNRDELMKYHRLLYNELDSMNIFVKEELEDACNKVSLPFNNNVDKILMKDITVEFVQRDIDRYL